MFISDEWPSLIYANYQSVPLGNQAEFIVGPNMSLGSLFLDITLLEVKQFGALRVFL